MKFGEVLRRQRESKGLTQQMLSQETGIPQTTISGWETNKNYPNYKYLFKLSKSLGIPVYELFNNVDEIKEEAS